MSSAKCFSSGERNGEVENGLEDDYRWGRWNVSPTTTCNSLSQDYTNLDDHISQTSIGTPRFKPFTLKKRIIYSFRGF